MAQSFIRSRTTWLGYLLQAFYGYFLNVFGPITPFLKNELNLSYTVSSLHFSAFALGIIGAGIASNRVIQRLGRRQTIWVGVFGLSVGALVLIAGHDPIVTIAASFLMGLVGSLVLAVVPSVLSDQHGEMVVVAYSEANLISSLISAAAPILVGWFAGSVLGWRAALVVGGLWAVVMRFGFAQVNPAATPLTSPSTSGSQQSEGKLPTLYWVYWTALMVSISIEFCMVFWSADYLEVGLGMAKASAAQAVSLFLAGMIVGRLASSRLVLRFSPLQVVVGSLFITGVGFLIYWTAASPIIGMVGLFVTGLGVSTLYPLILSLAIGSAKGSTVRAGALASLATGVAIFFLPLILGRLADAVGIRSAYGVIIVLVVAAFAIIQGSRRFAAIRAD